MPRQKKLLLKDAKLECEGGYRADFADVHDGGVGAAPSVSDAWVDKYAPVTLSEVCGQGDAIGELEECMATGVSRPIVCYGGPGVGKRTAASLCLRRHGCEVSEYSFAVSTLDDVRRENDPDANVLMAMCRVTRRKAIVCMDVACLSRREKNELYSVVCDLATGVLCVVIDTAPRAKCECIHFQDVNPYDTAVHLAWIAAEEGVEVDPAALPPAGDVRACVNALHFGTLSVWSRRADADQYVAFRALELLSPQTTNGLAEIECVAQLTDACSLYDAASWTEVGCLARVAAGMALRYGFTQSETVGVLARHAQCAGRQQTVRDAARTWAIAPTDGSSVVDMLLAALLDGRLTPPSVEAAHLLCAVCKAESRPAARKNVKALVQRGAIIS